MTREEAIERLKQNKAAAEFYAGMVQNTNAIENELKDIEAMNMAIEALSADAEQVTGKLNNRDDSFLTADAEAVKERKSKLDLIGRQDAIEAVATVTMSIHLSNVLCDKLLALPSADAVQIPIKLEKRYPQSRDEDITDAFMRGYLAGRSSADRPTGWIPVSERLPDIGDTFLVTVMVGTEIETDAADSFGSYIDGFWDTVNDWIEGEECHVIAWMPMPEPYREDDEA